MSNYFQKAAARAERRKSPWNLILIPTTIGGIALSAFLLAKIFLNIQSSSIPDNVILASSTRAGSILMFVPLIFPAICLGMIFANLVVWCIPSARAALHQEAQGAKHASFKTSLKHLSIAAIVLLLITSPLCFLGAKNYFYVTQNGITLNPLASMSEVHYGWDEITQVQIRCLAERKNLHLNYKLIMIDKTSLDLLEEPRLKFVKVYDKIVPFINQQNNISFSYNITDRGLNELKKRYQPQDVQNILKILGK